MKYELNAKDASSIEQNFEQYYADLPQCDAGVISEARLKHGAV